MIMSDRVQLQHVLMNLMLNGIESMKEAGGSIVVETRQGPFFGVLAPWRCRFDWFRRPQLYSGAGTSKALSVTEIML
jgi:hypothetical protein